jgi:LysR family transcriptional regulator, low CO2-responsive transcriptional regulator
VTPAQLRAYSTVVRLGSVKAAAAELEVSEPAISLHIGQLRKELGDRLFNRTGAGLAFTPGGLRLASRAAEILGLQNRTVLEVSQAGRGRRMLRIAASSLFAEHAAPGLIELFAQRADDIDVELSVQSTSKFNSLLFSRAVDVAIGAHPPDLDPTVQVRRLLNYQVIVVAGAKHRAATHPLTRSELREQWWLLGPSAAAPTGLIPSILHRLGIPETRQQIFQSHAAALEQTKHGHGIAPVVGFTVAKDLAAGDLVRVGGQAPQLDGTWSAFALPDNSASPAAAELIRFAITPRATQAMLRGSGVNIGRFRPSIHVTLWS